MENFDGIVAIVDFIDGQWPFVLVSIAPFHLMLGRATGECLNIRRRHMHLSRTKIRPIAYVIVRWRTTISV